MNPHAFLEPSLLLQNYEIGLLSALTPWYTAMGYHWYPVGEKPVRFAL